MMQLSTLLKFLVGSRQAIIKVATCRGSLLLGGLLVLSAGFAREYDGEDLLHDPWYLLVPLVASFATCTLLYCLLYLAARSRAQPVPAFARYFPTFLSLYWMTAPLAWLYAIPVERFLEPAGAVRFNLSLLAIVSLWRVLLITRCSSILFGSSYRSAFILVMLFADSVALGILQFTPLPIFDIMGGIHLTESETVLLEAAITVGLLGGVTWPVWLIVSGFVAAGGKRDWEPLELSESTPSVVSKLLWGLVAASLLVWVFVLPYTQPPLQLARQVNSDLKEGHIEDAIRKISALDRESFPTHWDPLPRPGYGDNSPPLYSVLKEINEGQAAAWVKDLYLKKLVQKLDSHYIRGHFWSSLEDEEFKQYIITLENSPEAHETARRSTDVFIDLLQDEEEDTTYWHISEERKQLLRSLLRTLKVDIPEKEPDESESPTQKQEPGANEPT